MADGVSSYGRIGPPRCSFELRRRTRPGRLSSAPPEARRSIFSETDKALHTRRWNFWTPTSATKTNTKTALRTGRAAVCIACRWFTDRHTDPEPALGL